MILETEKYRTAFENRLREKEVSDFDRSFLDSGKIARGTYAMPYKFKGDYTEHIAHENLFRRFGTVIRTDITDSTIICMDAVPEPEIVEENQSYPNPHEMRYHKNATMLVPTVSECIYS